MVLTSDVDAQRAELLTPWAEWRALLVACESYAILTGWRFVLADLMRLDQPSDSDAMRATRERAIPTALEYADRLQACKAALDGGCTQPPRLLDEFKACQRLVASEAVYNSMIATISAVGLAEEHKDDGEEGAAPAGAPEDAAPYHDMSQPVEVIARRLRAHHARVEASPALAEERRTRLMHASFIVEFGLEHGLPDFRDETSETMLKDFLDRLGEWEGARDNETVRALILGAMPPGRAGRGLRAAALGWFERNKDVAIVGGAVVGGVLGVLLASAAVAVASAAARGRSR